MTKGVLRKFAKFTGKHLCQSLFFSCTPQAFNFIKKDTLAQEFSCEFCGISKNTFFTEHLRETASVCKDIWIFAFIEVTNSVKKDLHFVLERTFTGISLLWVALNVLSFLFPYTSSEMFVHCWYCWHYWKLLSISDVIIYQQRGWPLHSLGSSGRWE